MWFVLWVALGVLVVLVEVSMLHRYERLPVDRGWTDYLMQLATVFTLGMSLLLPLVLGRSTGWDLLVWFWFVIGVLGSLLRALAMGTLRSSFTFSLDEAGPSEIVTTGLYRLVRHPGYSSLLLSLGAMAFIAGSWMAIVPVAVLWAAAGLRIGEEDAMLLRDPTYVDYSTTVRSRLISFV